MSHLHVEHGECAHCGEPWDWTTSHKHLPHKKTGQPRCLRKRPDRSKHQALVGRACAWLSGGKQRCRVVFAEPTMSITHSVDAIGWSGSSRGRVVSDIVECKTSLGDLRREFNKSHRRCLRSIGNRRWFLVPEEIGARAGAFIESHIAFFGNWGLLVARSRSVVVKRVASHQELSPESVDDERYLLMQAVRRHELGVRWDGRTRRFEPFINLKQRKSAASA